MKSWTMMMKKPTDGVDSEEKQMRFSLTGGVNLTWTHSAHVGQVSVQEEPLHPSPRKPLICVRSSFSSSSSRTPATCQRGLGVPE